jgi:tRNA threonylcarbamoyladenosine biosynthesis protein TsaE
MELGKKLARLLKAGEIVCLFGQLGAGKTVFTKGIALGLGIERREIVSPSFVLIREYRNKISLYHFDLYRLHSPKDIFALGYEEYFYNDGISVIEWAQRLKYLLPAEYLKIEFKIAGKTKRKIKISAKGGDYEKLIKNFKKFLP